MSQPLEWNHGMAAGSPETVETSHRGPGSLWSMRTPPRSVLYNQTYDWSTILGGIISLRPTYWVVKKKIGLLEPQPLYRRQAGFTYGCGENPVRVLEDFGEKCRPILPAPPHSRPSSLRERSRPIPSASCHPSASPLLREGPRRHGGDGGRAPVPGRPPGRVSARLADRGVAGNLAGT